MGQMGRQEKESTCGRSPWGVSVCFHQCPSGRSTEPVLSQDTSSEMHLARLRRAPLPAGWVARGASLPEHCPALPPRHERVRSVGSCSFPFATGGRSSCLKLTWNYNMANNQLFLTSHLLEAALVSSFV